MFALDLALLLAVVVLIGWWARKEAGHALMDTAATLIALFASLHLAQGFTEGLGWRPVPGTQMSAAAFALMFAATWGIGLVVSRAVHREKRWSMEAFDGIISTAFGVIGAVVVGHVLATVLAGVLITHHGALPPGFRQSLVSEELRSFRTVHQMVDTFHQMQNGG
jgi:hypothetical protein